MRTARRADWTTFDRRAYGYLTLSLDKLLNYNSRMSVWMPTREVVANTFNRHDFAFCWSHAEMAPLVVGLGYDWAIKQTAKCIKELINLIHPEQVPTGDLLDAAEPKSARSASPPPITITCKSADSLDYLADGSIDAVVMDPPYYDNVMYAELSDFFYVWLKRTAGHLFPELFPEAVHRQGERGGRQPGQVLRSDRRTALSPARTTRHGWRRSSPSAAGC